MSQLQIQVDREVDATVTTLGADNSNVFAMISGLANQFSSVANSAFFPNFTTAVAGRPLTGNLAIGPGKFQPTTPSLVSVSPSGVVSFLLASALKVSATITARVEYGDVTDVRSPGGAFAAITDFAGSSPVATTEWDVLPGSLFASSGSFSPLLQTGLSSLSQYSPDPVTITYNADGSVATRRLQIMGSKNAGTSNPFGITFSQAMIGSNPTNSFGFGWNAPVKPHNVVELISFITSAFPGIAPGNERLKIEVSVSLNISLSVDDSIPSGTDLYVCAPVPDFYNYSGMVNGANDYKGSASIILLNTGAGATTGAQFVKLNSFTNEVARSKFNNPSTLLLQGCNGITYPTTLGSVRQTLTVAVPSLNLTA